jgi:hypothetical protein
VKQFLRGYVCLLCLVAGGCGGALAVDGTLGERERARIRAAHPGEFFCGGAGIDIYLAGGFLLGVIPTTWAFQRFGVIRWAFANRTPSNQW